MAFPWIAESNFEQGTLDGWTSETDTQNKLDFPLYADLAAIPQMPMPWRGAYAMRIDLSAGNADAFLLDTTRFTMANASTTFLRFMLWFGVPGVGQGRDYTDPIAADGDRFSIFRFDSAGPVLECTVFLEYTTANGWRVGINKTLSATNAVYLPCTLNKWSSIEAKFVSAAGAAGTLTLYVDGAATAPITGLTNATITRGVMGAVTIPATVTKGILMFDALIVDETDRINPPNRRFPTSYEISRSQHVLLGPGDILNVVLVPANNDNIIRAFDTDNAETGDYLSAIVEVKTDQAAVTAPVDLPWDGFEVTRGCYIELTGTSPRARIVLGDDALSMSDGGIRRYGLQRRSRRPTDY